MSSSWTERHGQVGDLRSKSKEELCEILSRQEKILHNKRFINTLPDKGKKISDFVERVRLALANLKEEEKRQASLSSVRTEFQSKYQHAFSQRHHITLDSIDLESARPTLKKDEESLESATTNTLYLVGTSRCVDGSQCSETLAEQSTETTESSSDGLDALQNTNRAKDNELVEAFERVTLSEEKTAQAKSTGNTSQSRPFSYTQLHKKPHYIDVFDRSATSVTKPRFKPSQLLTKSASPSPGQSPGSVTPLSADDRRQRDRKHLDDITAARLPPLHHSPAQLLSLDESFVLLQDQTKKHQEVQAKLAAQKLAEGLTVSMSSYSPEEGALAAYREEHDDGALSEED